MEHGLAVDGGDIAQERRKSGIYNADLLDDVFRHRVPARLGNYVAGKRITDDPTSDTPRRRRIVDLTENDWFSSGVRADLRA